MARLDPGGAAAGGAAGLDRVRSPWLDAPAA